MEQDTIPFCPTIPILLQYETLSSVATLRAYCRWPPLDPLPLVKLTLLTALHNYNLDVVLTFGPAIAFGKGLKQLTGKL